MSSDLELVFDDPVVDVVLRDSETGFPVKAVLTEKEIIRYDSDGNESKDRTLKDEERIIFSIDGNCLLSYITPETFKSVEKLSVYDIDTGQEKFSVNPVNCIRDPEDEVVLHPSGDGIVTISSKDKSLVFYDSGGKVLNINNFTASESIMGKYSLGGEHFVAVIQNGKETKLIQYSISSEKKWEKQFALDGTTDFSISLDRIILYTNSALILFDTAGEIKWQQKISAGKMLAEITNLGVVVARQSENRILLIDTETGKVLWKRNLDEVLDKNNITFVDISKRKEDIQIYATNLRGNNHNTILMDKEGKVIWHNGKINNFEESFINKTANIYIYIRDNTVRSELLVSEGN